MTTLIQLCDTYREIIGIIIYKISIIEYHAWKISNRGQSVICQCESSDRFLFFVRIVEEICMTKLHCAKALDMRHNEGNEVHTNLENHVPNALSTRKRQIGHASLSFFRSCPQFPPSTRNIKSKRCEEPTTRSYRQKKKNKKKSCLCTSVYCVLDNLKNFPWCVFRTVFSVSEYFRSASSPSILNESWRV